MKHNKLTITINKSVEGVFTFTITPPNSTRWIPGIVKEETNELPIRKGTVYILANYKEESFTVTVASIQANEMIEWVSDDGNYHCRYTYKSIDENTTELKYYEWVDKGELDDPFTQEILERLKSALEKTVQVLRVFTNETGNFGNPVSIVIDEGKHISDQQRQSITRQLGNDETVFINDITSATVSIFNPQQEVKFAGHALVGTAWLLTKLSNKSINVIHCLGGDITTWQEDNLTWIRANLDMMPPWHIKQVETVDYVEKITQEESATMEHTMVWAWLDESKGLVRARTFASDWDIPEAEGNGSGAMILASMLKRDIEIKHGKGSIIFARSAAHNSAELGGRVIEDSPISMTV